MIISLHSIVQLADIDLIGVTARPAVQIYRAEFGLAAARQEIT